MNSIHIRIIRKYKLDYYLHILLTQNSANNNPYHNLYHLFTVMKNCYGIAQIENLSKDKTRVLLIAALFHDFNHSGSLQKDSVNIEKSISSFLEISKEKESVNESIVDIIKATEFPYTIETNKLSLEQKIIRDADIMQIYSENYLQQVIFGLLMSEQKMSLKNSIGTEHHFLDRVHPITKYAINMYDKNMQQRIDDMVYLNNLLNKYES